MKKIKVISKIQLVLLILLVPNVISARSRTSCDYTLLSNLKNLVSNVNISYTYHIDNDIAYFDITLTNIQNDIYFIDNSTNNIYHYNDTNNGVITFNNYQSGKVSYSFYSNNSDCLDEKLSIKYVNLPSYNKFYSYPECENIVNYNACKKWTEYNGSYEDFINDIEKYLSMNNIEKEEEINVQDLKWFNKLVKIYTNYYYIITPLFVGIIVGILYLVKFINYRKDRFKI